jgi:lysophospholipase L1-like esterase
MSLKHLAASLTLALPILAGCRSDDSLNPPAVSDPMFTRYAALGNSITAGFQSAGINDSTQQRSYARLLSLAMGTPFNYPSLLMPGCPAPFDTNTTQHRVGSVPATACGFNAGRPGLLNNLGVPGNAVGTLLSNFGGLPSVFDPLKTFMLGGRTELQLMQTLRPTFVSVWIGNNDVLGAFISTTNAGDTTQITPAATFATQFDQVADAIDAANPKGVVAVSVANVTSIPFASSAAIYFCLKNGGCPPPLPAQDQRLAAIPTFNVAASCAPPGGVNFLVPWVVGLRKVDSAVAGAPKTLSCTDSLSVISPEETQVMLTAIAAYNAKIAQVATDRGWAYWDVNPAFTALRAAGTIPPFPDVNGAFANPRTSVLFGPIFSLDGVHPSSFAHRLVADSVAAVINTTYGPNGTGVLKTPLPVPVCGGSVTCPAP